MGRRWITRSIATLSRHSASTSYIYRCCHRCGQFLYLATRSKHTASMARSVAHHKNHQSCVRRKLSTKQFLTVTESSGAGSSRLCSCQPASFSCLQVGPAIATTWIWEHAELRSASKVTIGISFSTRSKQLVTWRQHWRQESSQGASTLAVCSTTAYLPRTSRVISPWLDVFKRPAERKRQHKSEERKRVSLFLTESKKRLVIYVCYAMLQRLACT